MAFSFRTPAVVLLAALASCVGEDGAPHSGSVSFTISATRLTERGIGEGLVSEGWSLRVDRALLSFKTMTVGTIGDPDRCAHRDGGRTNLVFDVRAGHVQTFNGIESPECRDVGLVLGLPAGDTVPGAGASPSDLAEVASGPFHALIDVTAKRLDDEYRVLFRFEPSRTTTTFGGCYTASEKGVHVVPDQRQEMRVLFAVEQLFRDSTGSESATMRLSPFIDADERGNRDHIVTMDELDTMNLAYATVYASSYELPDLTGTRASFGDFVRWLFRSTVQFRDADGACVGNDPGK